MYKADGTDTIMNKTIKGSEIHFNIDQLNGLIYTVDSLPVWSELSRVVPTFTTYGRVLAKIDSLYYPINSGSDSLNFEKPLQLIAVATNGISAKEYTVIINRSQNDIDTLVWVKKNNNLAVDGEWRTVMLNNHVYTFCGDENSGVQMTSSPVSSELSSWTTPVAVQSPIIPSSILTYAGEFYALGTDGCIYKAEQQNRPEVWNKVSEKTFKSLLAADAYYLYALDGNEIVGTNDMVNWIASGNTDLDMLPTDNVHSFAYKSKTNSNIQICVMCGLSDNNMKNGVSWYKVTAKDDDVNQKWMYIQVTNDNAFGLKKMSNLSVTMHGGYLYAIGIIDGAYERIYRSVDNGITWKPLGEKYPLPADLDAKNGAATLISANGKLYIIQKGGKVWCGSIS